MQKISVIVPVYNTEKYLRACIQSILGQSLQNIQLILIDDGSTDGSAVICDEYAEKDTRVVVLHVPNGGPAKARNRGIEVANGEYIGFVDSDDYISPQMLEKLYARTMEYKYDLVMCGYNYVRDDSVKAATMYYPDHVVGNEAVRESILQRYYTGEVQGLYSLWTKIIRTSLIKDNIIKIDEELVRGEDAWFVYDVLRKAESFAYVDEPMYYYIQNPFSIMHSVREDQFERWKANKTKLLEDNEEYGFKIDYDKFYQSMLYNLAVYLRDLITEGKKDLVYRILKDPFYLSCSKHTGLLPYHIKKLLFYGRNNPSFACFLYTLWGKART